jgi:hypothetical protein
LTSRGGPQFRAAATVRHILAHQAGVVALAEPAPTEAFYDWDRVCGLLAAQEPSREPGTAHGESALFYGHLVGELVRRVDGRGSYGGTCTTGGYTVGFVTGTAGSVDRVEALENTLRSCLGLPSLPAAPG